MKKLIFLGLCVFLVSTLFAQNIQKLEYFFDTDPGHNNGVSITNFTPGDTVDFNFSVTTTGLNVGNHQLYIRFQNTAGTWGQYEPRPVYVQSSSTTGGDLLSAAEYFFDSDPGIGQGTPLPNFTISDTVDVNFTVSTNGLNIGSHKLYIRFKSNDGNWSLYEGRSFYIQEAQIPNGHHLVSAEYFIDVDPGIGNATLLSSFAPNDTVSANINVATSGLSIGHHQMYIRFLDNNGEWSLLEGRDFYVQPPQNPNGHNLESAEYFIDVDPGLGNGTAIPNFSPADTVDLNLNISTTGLALGGHKLYIRFINNDGVYSLYEGRTFFVQNPTNNAQNADVVRAEYFIDSDPGIGNGQSVPSFTPDDIVDVNFTVSTVGLSSGNHKLYLRLLDSDGSWSLYEPQLFFVQNQTASGPNPIEKGEYFFDSDPGYGNGIAFNNFTPNDTVDALPNISTAGLSSGFHNLYLRFRNANGEWGQYFGQSFYVQEAASPTVDYLTEAEYFIDSDPGFGNGQLLSTFNGSDSANTIAGVNLSGINIGFHTLYVRYKNSEGVWGHYEKRPFYVHDNTADSASAVLTDAEYFFNSDPGFGNGQSLTGFNPSDTVDLLASIDVSQLPIGQTQKLFVRFKDQLGRWGLYEGRTFERLPCDYPEPDFETFSTVCQGTNFTLSDLSETVDANSSYEWDTDNDGVTDLSTNGDIHLSFSNTGSFDVELKISNGVCQDSVTKTIIVNPTYNNTQTVTACQSYTWSNGITYTSNNQSDVQFLQSVTGCDSILYLDLTILPASSSVDVQQSCSPITWIDGITYTQSNNVATFVTTNALGCDSIIHLDFTLLPSTTGTDQIVACDSYTWIDGVTYTSSNNTATFVLQNSNGCDSIVTLDLTINTSTSSTDVISSCGPYTWIDGNTYTSSNNTATTVLQNINGCDSTVTLDLTVNTIYSETDVIEACENYTWIDGNTYTQNNNSASITFQSIHGCDSTITLNLTITPAINTTVNLSGTELSSAQVNAESYQWVDCNNGFQAISGATSDTYTPSANGVYAVIIENGRCTDTSECITIDNVGLSELANEGIKVYPNPTKGTVHVSLDHPEAYELMEVYDMRGALLFQKNQIQPTITIDLPLANGVYVIHLHRTDESKRLVRVVKF